MFWREKINNKVYISFTSVNIGFAAVFGMPQLSDVFWLVILVLCSVGNHYFMVNALSSLINSRIANRDAPNNKKLFLSVIFKTLFLIIGFVTLMLYAPSKVIQGLTLYIFQLIILGLSIKNIEKFFTKGS